MKAGMSFDLALGGGVGVCLCGRANPLPGTCIKNKALIGFQVDIQELAYTTS